MTIINDWKGSGALKSFTDFRAGLLYDPISGQFCTTMAGVPSWARTSRGFGIMSTGTAAITGVAQANAVPLQLNTCTIFAVAQHDLVDPVAYHTIFGKQNAYLMMLNPTTQQFVMLDPTAGSYRPSGITPSRGRPHLYVATIQSGVVNGTAMYVDGIFGAFGLVTVLNHASYWVYGCYTASANNNLQGSVLLAGVVNRVITPAEVSQLHTDWLQSGFVLDVQHRRGTKAKQRDMSDADYNRQGIFFDTDGRRLPGGLVRDLSPSGYNGTATGVPVPGTGGEGLKLAQTDIVDFGNITQFNSVASFTLSGWIDGPTALVAARYIHLKYVDANNHFYTYTVTAPTTSEFRVGLSNAGAAFAITTTQPLRRNARQHFAVVFNGPGATNADRLKVYIDREEYPLNFTGNIPATTANLAAANFLLGNAGGNTAPHTARNLRLRTGAAAAGQVSDEYLKTGAQKLIWQAPGEDCPVSLAASYGVANPNALGGGWRIISGTWKRSEDSQGRKWIECVTAGYIAQPQPEAFGTYSVTMQRATANSFYVYITSSTAGYVAGTTNAYLLSLSSAGAVAVGISTAGAYSSLGVSADGYTTTGVPYSLVVNRRPSDGRFTFWIKGGIYKVWTLVSTAGGGGSNPTAANATHVTSQWIVLQCTVGDKLLAHDPTVPGNPGHPRIYQGQLDPTKVGELP